MKYNYQGDLEKYDSVRSIKLFCGKEIFNPIFSFCIPTFKRIKSIGDTIKSIVELKLSFPYEIIICDNSGVISTNNELIGVLKSFDKFPVYLFVNEINIGMTGNWNRLIQLSRGKIISFVHDDDLLASNYNYLASRMLELLKTKKLKRFGFLKVAFRGFTNGDTLEELRTHNTSLKPVALRDTLICGIGPTATPTCGMMFSKEALIEIKGFCEAYYPCADHIVGFVLGEAKYQGFLTNDVFSYYRWGLNETLNINTQIQTYHKNIMVRNYIYNSKKMYSIFGRVFEKAQRYLNLVDITRYCRKFQPSITEKDIDDDQIQPSFFIVLILKIVKKINLLEKKYRRRI